MTKTARPPTLASFLAGSSRGCAWITVVAFALVTRTGGGPTASAAPASLTPVVAATATIRGRVELRHAPAGLEPRPNVADLGMGKAHGPTDRRRSVVYLETAPTAAFDQGARPRARIDQRDETFVPHLLAIVVGTTVEFPNNDLTYHNVFSLSRTKTFDLGRYAASGSKSVRFDRPGIVRVFCDIHSHMSAFILVFAHRYFALTEDDGRYRLDNVPPGSYTVIAWNETTEQEARPIVVLDTGGDIELNFMLGRR